MARYVFETAEEIVACEECPLSSFSIGLSGRYAYDLFCDLLSRRVASGSMDDLGRFSGCPLWRLDDRLDDAEAIVRALLVGEIGAAEAVEMVCGMAASVDGAVGT